MSSEQTDPKEELVSVHTGLPSRARRNVVEILRDAADADVGVFCKFGIGEDRRYYTSIAAVGTNGEPPDGPTATTPLPMERLGCDPGDPPREADGQFAARRVGSGTTGAGRPRCSPPVGPFELEEVRHEASALLYEGSRFLGWLAVYRRDGSPFDDEVVEELNGLLETAVEVLSEAQHQERNRLGERPARLLIQPENGEVRSTTPSGAEWASDGRMRALIAGIESLEDDATFPVQFNVDGFSVELDELTGSGTVRYLATVTYPDRPTRSVDAVLTPRQREVVGYAVAGATNREIAETLGISADTVSDHLSESYRRLGVANRVELARKVADLD